MAHLAFRVDGGPRIGYGHLVRTGALVQQCLTEGHTATVATTTPEHAREICPGGVEIVDLPSRGDPTPFVQWLSSEEPDLAFTDAYPVDTAYQGEIRDRVPLVVLQDRDRHTVDADAFVNPNLYAKTLDYEFAGSTPATYLGTEYVLFREGIRSLASREPLWHEQPTRALVSMGGSDVRERTPAVVRAFDDLSVAVEVIVGPGFSPAQERTIERAAEAVSAEVDVVRDPPDLPTRMFRADFAVTTASTTTYELLALGTPFVCQSVVDNQQPIADILGERDLASVVAPGSETPAFSEAIRAYVGDAGLRRDRATRGQQLVDGRGTERIAAVCSRTATD